MTYAYTGIDIDGRDLPGGRLEARSEHTAWVRAIHILLSECGANSTRLAQANLTRITREDHT